MVGTAWGRIVRLDPPTWKILPNQSSVTCTEQTKKKIPRDGKSLKAPLGGLRCNEIPPLLIFQLLLQNCTEQTPESIFRSTLQIMVYEINYGIAEMKC